MEWSQHLDTILRRRPVVQRTSLYLCSSLSVGSLSPVSACGEEGTILELATGEAERSEDVESREDSSSKGKIRINGPMGIKMQAQPSRSGISSHLEGPQWRFSITAGFSEASNLPPAAQTGFIAMIHQKKCIKEELGDKKRPSAVLQDCLEMKTRCFQSVE
ncbi:hypothetical protein BTVI_44341 [Pitangus sulphuratus]|nr:hypothetical protein BTVI_44341 [Pitangus sulphuratus]